MPNVGNERLPKAVRSIDGVDFGALNEATETRNEKLGAGIIALLTAPLTALPTAPLTAPLSPAPGIDGGVKFILLSSRLALLGGLAASGFAGA